jgi:4-amino-4-deoxy-L-arabinose transferase and related glycosyltransferases of PMT family
VVTPADIAAGTNVVLDRPSRAVAPARPAFAAVAGDLLATVRPHAPLAAILVVGGVLRVWALGAVGFNSDEAVYAGQAASIAGDPDTSQLFPVFRAHPLLFQTALSLLYRLGGGDVTARLLVAALGLATVVVVYQLGRLLYGPRVGLAAALLLAVMPYHVGVSRQVLLDVPMTFLATAALYAFARFTLDRSTRSLMIAALLTGFTVLTKETAILLVGGLVAFRILYPGVRPDPRPSLRALAVTAAVVAAYPVSLAFSGRTSTGQSYLAWQLLRRSNHTVWFYAEVVPPAMGYGVLAAAALGLWFLRRDGGWREGLLVCWAAVPVLFFEIWPVKGYQYLLVAAPVVAVLAARALVLLPVPRLAGAGRTRAVEVVRAVVVTAVAVSLAVPAWRTVDPAPTTTFLAGSGGLPAGREMGRWLDENVPLGARVMTIGPSMANIVRFYGHRPAVGLSVSPNPLSRNPSYEPIDNPDRELRQTTIQYVVWDAFTAARSPFFAGRLLRYVDKYHGVVLHTETIRIRSADGSEVDKPVMTVYEVRP